MINVQSVSEGIIGSLIASAISTVVTFCWKKKTNKPLQEEPSLQSPTPFSIALFITSFFTILSGFSFYYQWSNLPYLVVITTLIWIGSIWIYHNQCPNCKKIFKKITHAPDILREEKRPYMYRNLTVYKFSDGTIKDKKCHGKEKEIKETYRLQQDNFSCRSCGYKWKGNSYWINLDEDKRPKANFVTTRYKNPKRSI